jgi:methyl-accepting chemotaxis protein
MSGFKDISVRTKLSLMVIFGMIGFMAFGLYAFNRLDYLKVNGPIYGSIVQSKDLIADILPPPKYIIESYLNVLEMVDAVDRQADPAELDRMYAKAEALREEYMVRQAFWLVDLDEGELKNLMTVTTYDPAVDFYEIRDNEFIPAIQAGDIERAKTILRDELQPQYQAHRVEIDKAVALATIRYQQDEVLAAGAVTQTITWFILLGVLVAIMSATMAVLISLGIVKPLRRLTVTALEIAKGDIQQQIDYESKDEVGQLADGFRRMVNYQQEMATAAASLAEGDLTVQIAAQSEKDVLGNAFQRIVGYQKEMAEAARHLAEGDLRVQVKPMSSQDVLGNSFRQMIGYQQAIAGAVEQIARGNLTVEVTPVSAQDALGIATSDMIQNLRETVGTVQANAQRLLSSSRQLSQVSEQAGDATQQITQTIEMMSGTTQQVAQTIGQVALGAAQQAQIMDRSRMIVEEQDHVITRIAQGSVRQTQAIEAADHVFQGRLAAAIRQVEGATTASDMAVSTAVEAAESGTQAVSKTIVGFNIVAKTADQVTRRISEMGKRSHQIGAIVQVINDIAERTNLLSLNAAIEAARAGEHGKGFAVVADEVRKLAERSAKSAEEISQLVSTVQDAANQAVAAMEENDRQVQQGLSTAGDAEHALGGIRTAMAQVGGQMAKLQGAVADLSESSHKVQDVMQQVADVIEENIEATTALTSSHEPLQHAIEEIASVAEENSAAAEEVAASAEENSASVEEINAMTKSVNAQIDEVTLAVQALTTMASELQSAVATFQLTEDFSLPQPDERVYALPAPNGIQIGNGHNGNGHNGNGHNGNGHNGNGRNGWYN